MTKGALVAEASVLREAGYLIVLVAAAIILLAVAWRFLRGGGRIRLAAGKVETTIETTLGQIHEHVQEINRAVNHQAPGGPPMVERVIAIERLLGEHIAQTATGFETVRSDVAAIGSKLDTHVGTAVAWQTAVGRAMPDQTFPDPG